MYKQGDLIISKRRDAQGWNRIASIVADSTIMSAQGVIHAISNGNKSYINSQHGLYLTDTYKIGRLKEKWNFERAKN